MINFLTPEFKLSARSNPFIEREQWSVNENILQREFVALRNRFPNADQICLTHLEFSSDKWFEGAGSLLHRNKEEPNAHEFNYKIFNEELKNSYLNNVYNMVAEKYIIGRVRFMIMQPGMGFSSHKDNEPRLHIPIITNPDAHLYDANEKILHHLPADGRTWYINTIRPHGVMNFGHDPRIHLLFCLLGRKY